RDSRRTHSAIDHRGTRAPNEHLLLIKIVRRKPSVEADDEYPPAGLDRAVETAALVLGEGHRFFHEDMLARLERGDRLRGMVLVASRDQHRVDRGVGE